MVKLPNYEWLGLPNVELIKYKLPNRLLFASSKFLNIPKVDKLLGVNIFFSPHFFLVSLSPRCKRVTTFHDLSYLHFPEFLSWRGIFWHNFEMKPSWQSHFSDRIIAVSESTKSDLVEKYSVDPSKIRVIYSGVSPAINKPLRKDLDLFRQQQNLPKKFILSLAKLEPRKNVVGLIKAFNLLKRNSGFDDLNLVVVGSRGWLFRDIFQEAAESPYKNQIIFKDYVKDEDKSLYYSLASVFIYPSFFEGFGFPPLEAMTCGTPVIVSNNSSLPEVVQDAGILVDPHNISDIAMSMREILSDDGLRRKLVAKGVKRSRELTWQKCAQETLECLTLL